MTNTEENELIEKIANLLDKYLETTIDDLTNIDNMVQLEKKEARLQQLLQNNLKYSEITDGMECLVKVRDKHKGEMATITNDGDNLKVLFHKKVEGIAPGQSAVIYEGDDLIAGGFIMKK